MDKDWKAHFEAIARPEDAIDKYWKKNVEPEIEKIWLEGKEKDVVAVRMPPQLSPLFPRIPFDKYTDVYDSVFGRFDIVWENGPPIKKRIKMVGFYG